MKKPLKIMHNLDTYKQVPSKYLLIEYSKPANKYTHIRETYLTEQEAHDLNYAFAINGAEKRYVKATNRTI
mgnify:CR=1 FL=1